MNELKIESGVPYRVHLAFYGHVKDPNKFYMDTQTKTLICNFGILTNSSALASGGIKATFEWDGALAPAGGTRTGAVDYVRIMPYEWGVWPGGQPEQNLNPVERFTASEFGWGGESLNWDVGQGGATATIVETGGTTAQNLPEIHVRCSNRSQTSGSGDAVKIKASRTGAVSGSREKLRTAFSATFMTLKFDQEDLADANPRSFPTSMGPNTRTCEYVWGAPRIAGKMESTIAFTPEGIEWEKRGIRWEYGEDRNNRMYGFRLNRFRRLQALQQTIQGNKREVAVVSFETGNDADWRYDGYSQRIDASHPNSNLDNETNKAFRIDAPGTDPAVQKQIGFRFDLREIAEWNSGGTENGWSRTTPIDDDTDWHFNATGELPNCARVAPSEDGMGITWETVANHRPVASAGANQTVSKGQQVTLDGSFTDQDNDPLSSAANPVEWEQFEGDPQTLDLTDPLKPTFTAPNQATVLKFRLKVRDLTRDLHHHRPDNFESNNNPEVWITVQ